jgi:hypothetical protein
MPNKKQTKNVADYYSDGSDPLKWSPDSLSLPSVDSVKKKPAPSPTPNNSAAASPSERTMKPADYGKIDPKDLLPKYEVKKPLPAVQQAGAKADSDLKPKPTTKSVDEMGVVERLKTNAGVLYDAMTARSTKEEEPKKSKERDVSQLSKPSAKGSAIEQFARGASFKKKD